MKLSIKNYKGLKLSCIINKPQTDKKFPAVIILHGFGGYKEEEHLESIARELEKNKIVGVRFDASGFNQSEGTVDDFTFSNYVKDLESVHSYVKKLKFVDKDKIGIFGHSLGPMVGFVYASKRDDIKAFVSVASAVKFATNDAMGKYLNDWKKKGYFQLKSSNKKIGIIEVPYSFAHDAMKYDIRKYIKKVSCPKIFIVGDKDKTTLAENTKLLYEIATLPKKYIEIKGMDHFYKKNKSKVKEVNKEAIAFFKKHL